MRYNEPIRARMDLYFYTKAQQRVQASARILNFQCPHGITQNNFHIDHKPRYIKDVNTVTTKEMNMNTSLPV